MLSTGSGDDSIGCTARRWRRTDPTCESLPGVVVKPFLLFHVSSIRRASTDTPWRPQNKDIRKGSPPCVKTVLQAALTHLAWRLRTII
jgi:hypothetical protein